MLLLRIQIFPFRSGSAVVMAIRSFPTLSSTLLSLVVVSEIRVRFFFFFYFFSRRAKERTGGVGDRSLLCVLFSSGCCCVPDVRRIIHQSGRGTIAWLSLTYQWPGAARSFACAQPPLHSVRALGSIHPSETVSSSSIESITFRALFSLFVLFFDRLFSLFTSFFFVLPQTSLLLHHHSLLFPYFVRNNIRWR